MTTPPKDTLALKTGSTTAGENLRRAIESGAVIEHEGGKLELAKPRSQSKSWVMVNNNPPLPCAFLIDFLFPHVYARTAVPHGCSACYKVKVLPRTLRELVAAWQIAKGIACRSKWGTDLDNPYSPNVYAGYFYVDSVDMARAVAKVAREAFARDDKIGADIPMTIKRGCSEYEALLGPSDRYKFTPEMAEMEKSLKARFQWPSKGTFDRYRVLAHWIDVAFRTGDETYLDFTAGRRRRANMVAYSL